MARHARGSSASAFAHQRSGSDENPRGEYRTDFSASPPFSKCPARLFLNYSCGAGSSSLKGRRADIEPLSAADFATLQGKLRDAPRKLWIHPTDSVVLNGEISTRERHGVD